MVTGSKERNSIVKMGRENSYVLHLKQGRYHIIINSYYLLNIYYVPDTVLISRFSCLILTIAVLVRVG